MLAPFCDCDKWQLQSPVLSWDMNDYDETLRTFFDGLQDTQWLPQEELEAGQREQLAHIIRHAARTTPFYKDKLAPVLRGNGDIDWSRWSEIPVLKRSDLREHRQLLQSQDIPAHHGNTYSVTTSGTSGEPVTADWPMLAAIPGRAANWRMYEWHNMDCSADLAICLGLSPWPEGRVAGYWGPPWHERRGARLMISDIAPYHQIAEWIGRKQPRYFSAIPFTLPAIVEEMQKQKIRNPIDFIIGYGGQATPLCRKIVKDTLGISIAEKYGSEECGYIANECKEGSLHVLSELVLVEIVGDDNEPCSPGVEGRVLVTNLYNTAQPMIRYELGDIAAFGPPCSCGRSLPVLSPIAGRIKHMFRFPGEPSVAPHDGRAFQILQPHLDPSWYQIAQIGPTTVEVRFVSNRRPSEDDFRAARESLPLAWRNIKAEIVFKQFDMPPMRKGRKHIVFANEWDPMTTPGLA